jgi:hypothetical protein
VKGQFANAVAWVRQPAVVQVRFRMTYRRINA